MQVQTSRRLPIRSADRRATRLFSIIALALAASLLSVTFAVQAANTENDYIGSATGALTTTTSWSLLTLPAVTNDAVFGPAQNSGVRSLTNATLTTGSLDDFSIGTAVQIQNMSGAANNSTLIIGGTGNGGNSVSGTANDLIYAGNGATLNILGTNGNGGTGVLGVTLGQSGNFDIVGTSTISSIISDGGNGYAITKTGAGTLTLSGADTFSGGVSINAGTVIPTVAGALGTGKVSFGGGTLSSALATDFSGQFAQTDGQAYNFSNSVAVTFATALKSTGGTFTKAGAGTLTFTAANTYSGATTLNAGILAFSGAGSLASGTINLQAGGLTLINTGAGNNATDRIADTASVNLNGGAFVIGGSDQTATNVAETVGGFTLGAGTVNGNTSNTITVTPGTGTGSLTTLTAGSVTRAAGSTMALVNGAGLGSSAASTSRFLVTTAPALVGNTAPLPTGINAAAQNTQIVTGLVGEATATTGGLGTVTGVANTFLTYTAGGGFRPLNPTDEFTNNAFTTGNNTRITTAATTLGTATTINSLVSAASFVVNAALTNTSGMTLFNTTSTVSGTGSLAFGGTEGQIYVDTGVTGTISAGVTGTNGLTISGPGSVVLNGTVTLSGGTLANTQHFLTLGSTANNLAGASVVSSAGNGGILFIGAQGALTGASSLTATNGSQLRFTSATQTTPYASVPITLGDGNTGGGIYFARAGDNADITYPGQITVSSPTPAVIQNFNAGSNSVILSGGITGTGTGGLELQATANSATIYDRITLGGTLNYAGPTYLGGDSNLRVTLNATTLPSATVLNFRAATGSRTAQFDLNGNSQTIAGLQSLNVAGTAQVINSSATASTLTVNNTANYLFAGDLGTINAVNAGGTVTNTTGGSTQTVILAAGTANNFSLVKSGAGTLSLTGAGSYTGGTTISGGKLLVGNDAALGASTGAVTIGASGTLASTIGARTIPNVVTTSGTGSTLVPGATATTNAGVGALTLSGGLNLAAGGTIPFDLASTTATSDVINVTGGTFTGATGTGSGSITFAFNSLGAPNSATTYTLITFTGSTLAGVDLGDFSATGITGTFSLNANELDFTITPVPEPCTWLGGLLMVLAAGLHRRRKPRR